jgi:hypothetical protein
MDTNDAEQLMMPFFPHDPYLAVQSLSKALFENEGFRLPEWIWEAVVQQYFTFLQIQRLQMKQEHLREQLTSEDPFRMHTAPYHIMDAPSFN